MAVVQGRIFVIVRPDGRGALDALAFAHAVARTVDDVAVVRADLRASRTRRYLSDRADDALLFVIPVVSRPPWLWPFVNWHAFQLARALAKRAPVATMSAR